MRHICFLLILSFLVACNNNQGEITNLDGFEITTSDGVTLAEKYNKANEIAERGFLSNGVKNGTWVTYYSGKNRDRIRTLSSYTKGKLNGLYLEYSNRGQIEKSVAYLNNIYHGTFATFKNGRLEKEIMYDMGKLNGTYKEFDKRGNLQKVSNYVNDQLHGKLSYYDEGKLMMEYTYENGKKISGGIIEEAEEPTETAVK